MNPTALVGGGHRSGMHLKALPIVCLVVCIVFVPSAWTLESEIVRGYPCVKRSKQIYCPLPGSALANIYMATANSSLRQGPRMYARHFSVNDLARTAAAAATTTTTTTAPTAASIKTHVIYYTKQYDQSLDGGGGGGGGGEGQNAFDLNDEEEHRFMHDGYTEENVIDDGRQIRKVKRHLINTYIDENKALIRRMFGHQGHEHLEREMFQPETLEHYSSFHDGPNGAHRRVKRTARPTPVSVNKVDSCESTTEIVTPYWASNSAGKIRAIVNTQHLQQAIQQEVCKAVQTKRCNDDCSCEQKYKWHRLLAYDPDDDCKGIFMDWFLFPSCCVCRCVKL